MKVIGIIGLKNSGKTFFVSEIIKKLKLKNYDVASVKHAHHNFDIDHENTDSYIHRNSGSSQVIISSSKRWAKLSENTNNNEKTLKELLAQLENTDYVIIEGFKNEEHPKIEVIKEDNSSFLYNKISNVVGLISNQNIPSNLPQFKRNEIDHVVNFIINEI